jgi:hypothetical protein
MYDLTFVHIFAHIIVTFFTLPYIPCFRHSTIHKLLIVSLVVRGRILSRRGVLHGRNFCLIIIGRRLLATTRAVIFQDITATIDKLLDVVLRRRIHHVGGSLVPKRARRWACVRSMVEAAANRGIPQISGTSGHQQDFDVLHKARVLRTY